MSISVSTSSLTPTAIYVHDVTQDVNDGVSAAVERCGQRIRLGTTVWALDSRRSQSGDPVRLLLIVPRRRRPLGPSTCRRQPDGSRRPLRRRGHRGYSLCVKPCGRRGVLPAGTAGPRHGAVARGVLPRCDAEPFRRNTPHLPSCCRAWSRRSGLNRGPADYESAALPLSYAGLGRRRLRRNRRTGIVAERVACGQPPPAFRLSSGLSRNGLRKIPTGFHRGFPGVLNG